MRSGGAFMRSCAPSRATCSRPAPRPSCCWNGRCRALARGDLGICDEVIRGDDEVDKLYLDVERRILGLFALQTPVASDLRLLTALLHINLHLERIADQAVNIAKITKLADGLPANPTVLQHLGEMGTLALGMVGAVMGALARRDLELARKLPEMDDPIDRLNRG